MTGGSSPWQRALERLDARFQNFGNLDVLENVGPWPRIALYGGIGITLNIVAIGVFLAARGESSAAAIAYGIGVLTTVTTVAYLFTGRARMATAAFVAIGVIGVLSMHVALGGYAWSGGWLGWSLLHVTMVALFFSRVSAVRLVAFYLTAAVALAILEHEIQQLHGGAPDATVPAVLATDMLSINLVLLPLLAGLLVYTIGREQRRNLDLLGNLLPASIARQLKTAPGAIAERSDECTVLFADLVGFTQHTTEVAPDLLVDELNVVFSRFDRLVSDLGVEKVKTIGDGYMAVAGVPLPREDHITVMCELGLRMGSEMRTVNQQLSTSFRLRVGIASGEVVAGVIGTSRFSYDLWGDTVNVASRLENLAAPGQILVSDTVAAKADHVFRFRPLGPISLRGRGEVLAHSLEGRSKPS